ncbi:hypothetical protein PS850_05122 [Pseudomonas fluorescens]|nr:hypothetical protein PS903_02303 [Pseudomonas fluorescens]VVP45378.1 hypothetical protein PS850_05122 [Pseudomonas fluorescens]
MGREWVTRNVALGKSVAPCHEEYTRLCVKKTATASEGFLYMIGRRSCMIWTMMAIRVTAMKIDWMKWLGRGTQIGFVVAAIAGYYGCQP